MIMHLFNRRPACFIVLVLLFLNSGICASKGPVVSLGELDGFWRYSAALGPFHEVGQGLTEVPSYLFTGDFPYIKKPFPREALFADHLSMVRLLGGFKAAVEGKPADTSRDLAYRDANGKIGYRMELLEPRMRPYLENGYDDLTIVLDNIPWCFPSEPLDGPYGQRRPPAEPAEWYAFVQVLCHNLVEIMGFEAANRLRFRVGTEMNGRDRFDGTLEEYVQHYEVSAAAIRSVLPAAAIGAFNVAGISPVGVKRHNVSILELARHFPSRTNAIDRIGPTPFDWVAYSRYFRPGDDPSAHANVCREVWEMVESVAPRLRGVSREIHEFGIAPWDDTRRGLIASSEPGALGAALTFQMMIRLRAAGLNKLWHWGVLDLYRNDKNELLSLPKSEVWFKSVLEYMSGGEVYLIEPMVESKEKTNYLGLVVRQKDQVIAILSSYHQNIEVNSSEQVTFPFPGELAPGDREAISWTRLDRESAVHDAIRADLAKAGLLRQFFVENPARLGGVRQMGISRDAERLVGENHERYLRMWTESMTLKPLGSESITVGRSGPWATVSLDLTTPSLVVLAWSL